MRPPQLASQPASLPLPPRSTCRGAPASTNRGATARSCSSGLPLCPASDACRRAVPPAPELPRAGDMSPGTSACSCRPGAAAAAGDRATGAGPGHEVQQRRRPPPAPPAPQGRRPVRELGRAAAAAQPQDHEELLPGAGHHDLGGAGHHSVSSGAAGVQRVVVPWRGAPPAAAAARACNLTSDGMLRRDSATPLHLSNAHAR